jgi:heme exporter protein D
VSWGSWEAFWAMGGYGLYVWGSYAMVAAVLGIEIVLLRSRRRAAALEAARAVGRDGTRSPA